MRNFKRNLWNSTQNILPIHWKIWFLYNIEILWAIRFKSSYAFFKTPPPPPPLGWCITHYASLDYGHSRATIPVVKGITWSNNGLSIETFCSHAPSCIVTTDHFKPGPNRVIFMNNCTEMKRRSFWVWALPMRDDVTTLRSKQTPTSGYWWVITADRDIYK